MGIPLHLLFEAVLDLINRKNEENDDLQNQLYIFKKLLDKAETEIERLKDKYSIVYASKAMVQSEARAEAIKDFAERVKEKKGDKFPFTHSVFVEDIDQIAKEMGVEL
jgi:hypothetical protein